MSLALWHWHIGITSKCTLRCPRCIRTEIPEVVTNRELDLNFFKRNFPEQFIIDHVERITFCGNDGDPIYASELIDIIKYFKSVKPVSITIITNGSHKSKEFWLELGSVLTEIDQVHFSIDGYDQESNNIYRVNSNWDSIIYSAKILRRVSNVYMVWAAILFKFNEDHINHMKNIARQIGFDVFQLTQSTKFRKYNKKYPENDPLEPSVTNLNDTTYQRSITTLNNRRYDEPYKKTNIEHFNNTEIIGDVFPLCFTGLKGVYIDAEGYFYPCCWVANKYPHNKVWNERRYDLNKYVLENVLKLDYWKEKFIHGSRECIIKCDKKYKYTSYNSRENA